MYYFAGTAFTARRNATLALARGDAAAAEEIYTAYIARRPADPAGFIARAEFYGTQDQYPAAIRDYLLAVRLIVARAAPDYQADSERVVRIATAMLQLQLLALRRRFAGREVLQPAFLVVFDIVRDRLLIRLPKLMLANLPERGSRGARIWREALAPGLRALWQGTAEPLRHTMLDDAVQSKLRQQYRDSLAVLRKVADGLPMPWQEFVHTIVDAWEEATALRQDAGPEEPSEDDLDEEAVEAVARRVRDYALRIVADEVAEASRAVAAVLGTLWERALAEPERRYLACALHCAHDRVMARFASLPLGCAVEHALIDRLIAPLREVLRDPAPRTSVARVQ